ncbi:hypothetical protein NCCP2716_12690 [Sporosarcina sp. NCCP-2716]|uniref:Spo0B domain-containing protein n=1 Tax=Sporosarcina sp. NCCP-2716 TaxID=2943679 RepID=UPI0020418F8A|nr:Spo0B domain-containing protein [Sporosarcina sp. NCCP-2716]GKV68771.1 hypothetical protein NCCP2716_12690 [Sporosarcina sp. NCCP-2716]
MSESKETELTVRGALQFARHDFLNELQLILMQLDLGRVPEARSQLLEATERMRSVSRLGGLGMPGVETWLLTFSWRYKTFTSELEAQTGQPAGRRLASEEEVVRFLDSLFRQLEEHADPFAENTVEVMVSADGPDWKLTFTLPAEPVPIEWDTLEREHWTAEVYRSTEYWTFTIRGQ